MTSPRDPNRNRCATAAQAYAHAIRVRSRFFVEEAGVVVRTEDERTSTRVKYASAHDIRRGCAQRLINAGVSAETLKVVMRHADFATTEKYYGATRSAQAAASEVRQKMTTEAPTDALVGRLVGRKEKAPELNAEELLKLKALLERL